MQCSKRGVPLAAVGASDPGTMIEGAPGNLVRIDAALLPAAADCAHLVLDLLPTAQFPLDPALHALGEVMALWEQVHVVRDPRGNRCILRRFAATPF